MNNESLKAYQRNAIERFESTGLLIVDAFRGVGKSQVLKKIISNHLTERIVVLGRPASRQYYAGHGRARFVTSTEGIIGADFLMVDEIDFLPTHFKTIKFAMVRTFGELYHPADDYITSWRDEAPAGVLVEGPFYANKHMHHPTLSPHNAQQLQNKFGSAEILQDESFVNVIAKEIWCGSRKKAQIRVDNKLYHFKQEQDKLLHVNGLQEKEYRFIDL